MYEFTPIFIILAAKIEASFPYDQPLYIMATTPAELPRNGPRLVTPLRIAFSLIFGGAPAGTLLNPSANPRKPPKARK